MAPRWCHSPRERKASRSNGGERHRASSALLLSLLVSLYILFLPAFGPLMDHHFAEKVPNHAHVYLGQSGPEHVHPFETRHGHLHLASPQSATSAGLSEIYGGPDGIVYLAPNELTGQSVAVAMLTVAPASIVLPQPPRYLFRSGLTGDEDRLLAAFVEPLRRPPRA
jgi:hypothetical protein